MQSTNSTAISLGKPITSPTLIAVKHRSTPTCINSPFMVSGKCYSVTAMSFGTPHGAVFVEDADNTDVPALGLALGTHPLFPEGASIVFIQVLDNENLKARLWQRGEGEISFTHEAACVAGTATMMLQKTFEDKINVSMGSGTFSMQWDKGSGNVYLCCPPG